LVRLPGGLPKAGRRQRRQRSVAVAAGRRGRRRPGAATRRTVRPGIAGRGPDAGEVFECGHTEDGTFYYAMEYLPGLNLEELVSRHGPLPPEQAIHLLRQVCGALREAHGIGLVHRDIKPGNVIVCERGGICDVAKLLDFGLVRAPSAAKEGQTLT